MINPDRQALSVSVWAMSGSSKAVLSLHNMLRYAYLARKNNLPSNRRDQTCLTDTVLRPRPAAGIVR